MRTLRTPNDHAVLRRLCFAVFAITTLTLSLLATPETHAHEGDHGAPGLVEAPRGGEIKALETVYVEVLTQGSNIKIYLYSKDLKPMTSSKGYALSAEAKLPRLKAKEKLTVVEAGGVFTTSYNAKGAHRFSLILTIQQPGESHADTLEYTIEPRR